MRRCLELAETARQKTNFPFGALLVRNGTVLWEEENSVVTDRDPTRHAELKLISNACRTLSRQEVSSAILYSSTEPCLMCAGSIYWADIGKVVYGCSEASLRKLTGQDDREGEFGIACRDILRCYGIELVGPILEREALRVHEGFWDNADSRRTR